MVLRPIVLELGFAHVFEVGDRGAHDVQPFGRNWAGRRVRHVQRTTVDNMVTNEVLVCELPVVMFI